MTVEPNTARLPIFTFPVSQANSLENCSSATALVTSPSPLHRIAMYVAQLFHILALARDILTVIVQAVSQTHLLLRSAKTNPALLRKRWGTLAYSEDRKNREGWATRRAFAHQSRQDQHEPCGPQAGALLAGREPRAPRTRLSGADNDEVT